MRVEGKSSHKDDRKDERRGKKKEWPAVIFSLLQMDTRC